ncbi:MAG: pyruvate ferredoxin oxidoreductase subunit gamma [Nanoarchaeota archaeon]|nr:pyruvate ferredoxin oxidoreductase subunit gamma [Nanoarchaeota archaeon]MBU4300875.1 pyruvate ferredoxin oxidoreductase subunit gamma [Nanoarchaeota archaeon]MBU4451419.1 pyruvate ferredoxin oxidoreductase subunit gamma [Nanoarchaeota archaeon]MCG2724507.1 pyruvate ferredoxin oxidoreductase subunit gamma [archaeon]
MALKQIRIHGRGGQGVVTCAELLAAAAFKDGKQCQAFPFFGVERRGAPVAAFCRIDDKAIRTHEQVYEPDYVMVLDASLLEKVNVAEGLNENGIIVINTTEPTENIKLATSAKIKTIDATKIALDAIGKPFVNAPMLGAFVAATGLVKLDSLIKSVEEAFSGEIAQKNVVAVKKAYEEMKNKK